jgi:hypothetical protein
VGIANSDVAAARRSTHPQQQQCTATAAVHSSRMLVANVCSFSVHGPYIGDKGKIWVFLTRRSICNFLTLQEVLEDDNIIPSIFCREISEYHRNSKGD